MTAPARPLIVVAGKINPAGVAQLESEARVVIAPNQETHTVIELSGKAEGILFRAGPRCDDTILGACPHANPIGPKFQITGLTHPSDRHFDLAQHRRYSRILKHEDATPLVARQ